MVISQEPTQSLAALNKLRLAADIRITREQQDVNLALVIALGMIMFDVFVQRPPQRALTQDSTDDQSCERQERDLRAFAKRAAHKVIAVFKETASGVDDNRPERAKVMALARAHEIDAILVSGRWGRSTQDLVRTLDDLHGWKVSVLAQTGLSFDLSRASGKLMRTIMAGLTEFERDLIRDRVKSGLAAARARGIKLGPPGRAAAKRSGQGAQAARRGPVLSRHRPTLADVDTNK